MTARNHPKYTAPVDDGTDDRATHPLDFAELNDEHGPFTVDAAAAAHNARLPRYWDRAADGLTQPWAGEHVWCNPPFSDLTPWIRKAWAEHADCSVTMLLPANRTEQQFWQIMVEPFRDQPGSPLSVRFLGGRMRFIKPGHTSTQKGDRPPFGCCLLLWRGTGPRIYDPTTFLPAGGLLP